MAPFLSSAASIAGSAMFFRSMARDILPIQLQDWISSQYKSLLSRPSPELTICIEEYENDSLNPIYEAADVYLGSKTEEYYCAHSCFKVTKTENMSEKGIGVKIGNNQVMQDRFQGIQLRWKSATRKCEITEEQAREMDMRSVVRVFFLSFHHKYKDRVLNSYLPYLLRQSHDLKEAQKGIKLYALSRAGGGLNYSVSWESENLDHPATFQTLAMDPELKSAVIDDLDRFVQSRDFYRSVGKAWKRGYLLHGPPGTGKSSLIAAIANYLHFNIYDLELSDLNRGSDLRKLLIFTANRSILVIEDIDCTDCVEDRASQSSAKGSWKESELSLSALLNCIDGLWTGSGDERIIILTTNHKDKLDPALLRPGRMDMHIHMSYCSPKAFRVLANNYLGLEDHPLFEIIDALIQEVNVTPAEVAEELMRHEKPQVCLMGLIQFLREKKKTAQINQMTRDDEREKRQRQQPTAGGPEGDHDARKKKKIDQVIDASTTKS